jgi:Ca2+-transporting ATPase
VRSPWRVLSIRFTEVIVVVLAVAAAISLLVRDLKGSVVILIIVVLSDALGFTQEQSAERSVTAFKRATVPTVKARWGGPWQWLPQRRPMQAVARSKCRMENLYTCCHSYS